MRINNCLNPLILVAVTTIQLGAVHTANGQTIRGSLLEQASNAPVAGATVSLISVPTTKVAEAKTNSKGEFTLNAKAAGTFRLRAVATGYRIALSQAIELENGDDVSFTLHVMPDTMYLQPVVVTANKRRVGQLGGFDARMKNHVGGYFITRDQIDKRRPFEVTDLLRTVAGIRTVPGRFGNNVVTSEGCRPSVYVDGLRFPLLGESIDNIVNPQDVEGIEVYPHAIEAPPQYTAPGRSCGSILIWTRTGGA